MKHFNLLSNFRWFTTVILLITFGIGQTWADYTVTFKTVNTEETSVPTINKSNLIYSGGDYVNSISGARIYRGTSSNGLKFGSNSYAGNVVLTMTSTGTYIGQIQASAIKFNDAKKTNGDLKYTITYTDNETTASTQSLSTTAASYTIKLDSTKTIKSVKIENTGTKKQFYVKGFTVLVGYTITYDCDGASSGCPTNISHTRYLPNPLPDAPTKSGYTFIGWYTNAAKTTDAVAGAAIAANTTLYAKWEADASCDANPTIGNASLNGSISLSSLPVQTTGWTVGSNCEWSDFGFVWSTSVSTPTLESNGTASTNCTKIQKATSGTATSTSHSITGTFSVGATYYVRGYGKNRYASGTYQYTDVLSITPRSITFNSNGGSSVSTIYVNSGTAASAPTAPTKTGYTFGGWYTDNGTFESAVNWSSTISENKTYYAKWTAKQCTISFDIEGGTGTITNVTATYGQAMPSKESNLPTKTGYNFGGFWDGDGGTGTQYYNADGTSKINWNKDVTATQTLYAKWTIKNYTVTWKVNGEDYTAGTPTDNVNHGSHVTTLPTAPSPASYCGSKFMGWTDADGGVYTHGTSNLYTKASEFPNATTAQTFYAVFADYKE